LCRLLTQGKRAADKGECRLTLDDLLASSEGQLLVAMPPHRFASAPLVTTLDRLMQSAADGVWLGATVSIVATMRGG
ncbi:MAG: error-prone polymerase, DnaE-like protein, partial [Tardiphaga sp.]|nr:error-prone polymerase, DnaE-like protein [Tardiphaga sp.]